MSGQGDDPFKSAWLRRGRVRGNGRFDVLYPSTRAGDVDESEVTAFNDWFFGAAAASYSLTVNPATVAIAGQSVTLQAGRLLTASPGTVAVAGQSVGLSAGRSLTVSPATVAIAGQSVNLSVSTAATARSSDERYPRGIWPGARRAPAISTIQFTQNRRPEPKPEPVAEQDDRAERVAQERARLQAEVERIEAAEERLKQRAEGLEAKYAALRQRETTVTDDLAQIASKQIEKIKAEMAAMIAEKQANEAALIAAQLMLEAQAMEDEEEAITALLLAA